MIYKVKWLFMKGNGEKIWKEKILHTKEAALKYAEAHSHDGAQFDEVEE